MATDTPLIDDAAFNKASEAGKRLLLRGPLATAVRYAAGRVHVELSNGCAFAFPASHTQGLAGAEQADLKSIEISAAGLGLYWPRLEVDLYVPSLLKGVLGTKHWMAQIGSAGGKAKSTAKSLSSRANGKLGGRPKASRLQTVE